MKVKFYFLLTTVAFVGWICLLSSLSALTFGQENQPPAQTGFSPFREIIDRNIFDPTRRDRTQVRPTPAPTPVPVDQLQLVGTLITDATAYAFFNGSRAEYNAVLMTGGLIANCTVEEIQASQISLRISGQPLILKVGMQLSRREKEDWQISTAPIANANRRSSTRPSTPTASTSSPPSSGDDPAANDILKRLMERRRQEMGQ